MSQQFFIKILKQQVSPKKTYFDSCENLINGMHVAKGGRMRETATANDPKVFLMGRQ